ncbi:MAG TPA: hypothetical protein VMT10_01815 [Solirubrobacteraceae bacterium]|nr:hypothetical protein [Solirubrobacteraceae bacterium]
MNRAGECGQASVELVALLPLIAALALAGWQGVVAAQERWLAAGAARAAARAQLVGRDPGSAARRLLPGGLARRVQVARRADGRIEVRLPVETVVGGLRLGSVRALAGPSGGGA